MKSGERKKQDLEKEEVVLLKKTGVGLAKPLKNICMTNYPLNFEKGTFRKGHKACCALGIHFFLSDDLGWSSKT